MKATKEEIGKAVRAFTLHYWNSGMDVAHEPFSDENVYDELFTTILKTKPDSIRLALLEVQAYAKLIYDCRDDGNRVKIVGRKATDRFARVFINLQKSSVPAVDWAAAYTHSAPTIFRIPLERKPYPIFKVPTFVPTPLITDVGILITNDLNVTETYVKPEPMASKKVLLGNLMEVIDQDVRDLVLAAINDLTENPLPRSFFGREVDAESVLEEISDYRLYDNSRPVRRYGQCNPSKRVIEMHPILHRVEGEYKKTLVHEIAHALEYAVYGTSGHGPRWKKCMRAMGVDASDITRCNSLGLLHGERVLRTNKKRENANSDAESKWTYTCDNCSKKLNFKRKLRNVRYRTHKACGHLGTLTEKRNW